MQIQGGRVFGADGIFREEAVYIAGDRLAFPDEHTDNTVLSAGGCYVVPGFIDIHIHGADGFDVCDGRPDSLAGMARFLARHGVTSFLGATMSVGEEALCQAAGAVAAYRQQPAAEGATLWGVNMEGPFFAEGKKGAQSAAYLRLPDETLFRRVYDCAGGAVRLLDIAPELPGALPLIAAASKICRVSLAHTTCSYDTAAAAFHAGASHVTHLFNAMPSFHHREPGLIGAAVDFAAFVELIGDGIHVHPAAVRSAFRLFSDDRLCLISDAMRACGLPDGAYMLGGQAVQVSEGRARLEDGSQAGSVTDLSEIVRRVVGFGVPLSAVLKAATIHPARAAGIDRETGSLEPGKRADILLLDEALRLRMVMIGGRIIWQEADRVLSG